MTRAVTDGSERARLSGDVAVYVRVLIEDGDGVWRDLTNFHGTDWVVRVELSRSVDDRAMTATIILVRDGIDTDVGAMSLSPTVIASPANYKADSSFAPLVNANRKLRVLTDTEAYGTPPLTASTWKRVFDGKIDAVDPANSPDGTMAVHCRDRAAWLLNTWIETARPYGSDAGLGTAIETVVQQIITDNGVPGTPTLVVPVSPNFNLGKFEQADDASVMDAIYTLALLQGADIRYVFPNDGDTDPELRYFIPERTKTVPDWTFGPTEYLEIPRAPIDDSDVRNAITIDYFDAALGERAKRTRTNLASINAFGRRWGKIVVKDHSQLDSDAEADALGDAVVSDLGAPPFEHEMRTVYFWPIDVGDLVRFLANATMYDQPEDLAVIGFTHVLEAGEGYTTIQCRGTPAGAYRGWIQRLGTPGGFLPAIHATYQVVDEDATTITFVVRGTIAGSDVTPLVAWSWGSESPVASRISGAAQGVFVPSGSQWKFAKPNPGTGTATLGFLIGSGATGTNAQLQIPIPVATAFGGPIVNDPVVVIHDDPTNSFEVTWTVSGMPSGATYVAHWTQADDAPWRTKSAGTSLTVTILQSEHHQSPIHDDPPNSNATFYVYIEAFDSGGVYLASSQVVPAPYKVG